MAETNVDELLTPGQYFGDYKVVRRLGKGGMGVVYLVEHPAGGQFAVKIVDPEAAAKDPEFVQRFAREGAFAMKIRHPNLIAVYEMGQDPETGYYFLVMDYMPGGDVAQRLRQIGIFPIDEAVRIVAQVANALVEAHRHGVVHRDIKPSNIMFDAEGTPKLSDLGVAKFSDKGQTMLTSADVMIGTPAYMAPEQITDSHGVDARADIYALGMVFFEMLAGQRPNEDMSVLQIVAQALEGKSIPDVRTFRPDVPAMIAQLLNMMCMPQREMRIGSARQVVTVFNRILGREQAETDSQVQRILQAPRPGFRPMHGKWQTVIDFIHRRKTWVIVGIGFLVALALIVGVGWLAVAMATRSMEKTPVDVSSPKEPDFVPLVPSDNSEPSSTPNVALPGHRGDSSATDDVRTTAETNPVSPVVESPQTSSKSEVKPPAPVPEPEVKKPQTAGEILSAVPNPQSGTRVTVKLKGEVEMEFVYCGPGSFTMGSPSDDFGRGEDEKRHLVTLTKGFWIGRLEVTKRQWYQVMRRGDSRSYGDACPVVNVSWNDCRQFCEACGAGFRLPTEAEWEYACRAGNDGKEMELDHTAWYRANSERKVHAVGEKRENAWGICDCLGNVWEWCSDWYGPYPIGAVSDPQGPENGSARVVRGGCFTSLSSSCRSAARSHEDPGLKQITHGFRLCWSMGK